VKGRFLLDIVVRKGTAIFQLFTSENKTLLIGRDTFFILDLRFHIFNGVWSFYFKGNSFSSESFDKDLHTTSQTKDQMKSRFLLDVVVRKSSSVFQLLTSEDQALLIGRDTFLVLNLGLHVFNGIRSFHFEGDGLTSEGFNENLHTTTQTKYQVKGRFLLDIVVRKGTAIFQLFTSENKTLLIGRDTFFILDLRFHIFNGVWSFYFKGNSFSSESFDKDLHTTSQTKDQMKSRFLLDVVVRKSSSVFQLLTSEDQALLIGRDTFLVLDFSLDVFNGVRSFYFKSDSFSSQGLDENLHTTT